MNRKKIHYHKMLFLAGMVFMIILGYLNKNQYSNENTILFVLTISSGIFAMTNSYTAISFSNCPKCKKYLTYKRDWIGKHCKHCGEIVKDTSNLAS